MDKKKIFIVLTLAITLSIVIWGLYAWLSESGTAPPQLIEGESGHDIVAYPKEGVSVSIPRDWQGVYYESIKDGVKVSFRYGSSTYLSGFLDYADDERQISFEKIRTLYPGYSIEIIEGSNRSTLRYFGKVSEDYFTQGDSVASNEEIKDSVNSSYTTGRIVKTNQYTAWIHCQVDGPQYSELVSRCNSFVESLSID